MYIAIFSAVIAIAAIVFSIYLQKKMIALKKAHDKKVFWYDSMLDALPFPISVTDMDMKWTFVNKAAEGVTGKKRKEVLGVQCSNWGADICKTNRCGIECLRRDQHTSFFTQPGLDMDFQVDAHYLLNELGEKAGHIEIVQDVSVRQRDLSYQQQQAEKLSAMLEKVAQGDLTQILTPDSADKYTVAAHERWTKLTGALNQSFQGICSVIRTMSDSTKVLTSNAEESSSTSNQIASAIEEMNSSFGELSKLFQEQRLTTEETVTRMAQVIGAVTDLQNAAKEITKVVQVISDIADQTNLLALNATIEAASAGDAGKGFAVVASEVKALARQTGSSTSEISRIVDHVTDSVRKLESLAENVNTTISEKLNQISITAAAAVEEQSVVIREIASTASQTSAGSNELANLSHNIKAALDKFTI